MSAFPTKTLVGAALLAAALAVPASTVNAAQSGARGDDLRRAGQLTVIGLIGDGTKLVRFSEGDTRRLDRLGAISGLSGDTLVVGIDYRVQNGRLYGVGDQGGIYTIAPRPSSGPRANKVGQLSVALEGASFGVDFNPAANRLRVVSDTGQNLRHNIDDPAAPIATTVDATLTYPPLTTPAAGITAAAYTNNDLDADTATTLFDLDTALDQVAVQSPANNGTLAPTGLLNVKARSQAGFDIYSTVRRGTTVDLEGYAVLQVGGTSGFYEIDMLTGRATFEGSFKTSVTDLAIPLAQR